MIKTLVKKGWTKNEVIYEVQRIYGNDVLILKRSLDDDRGMIGRFGVPITLSFSLAAYLFFRRRRFTPTTFKKATQSSPSEAQKADGLDSKEEILRKLNIKR